MALKTATGHHVDGQASRQSAWACHYPISQQPTASSSLSERCGWLGRHCWCSRRACPPGDRSLSTVPTRPFSKQARSACRLISWQGSSASRYCSARRRPSSQGEQQQPPHRAVLYRADDCDRAALHLQAGATSHEAVRLLVSAALSTTVTGHEVIELML